MTMSKTTIPEATGVAMTGLEQAVENVLAEVDRLRALNAELLAALKVVDGRVLAGEPCPVCWTAPHLQKCCLVAAIAKAEGRS